MNILKSNNMKKAFKITFVFGALLALFAISKPRVNAQGIDPPENGTCCLDSRAICIIGTLPLPDWYWLNAGGPCP